jgi:hypothetical protein
VLDPHQQLSARPDVVDGAAGGITVVAGGIHLSSHALSVDTLRSAGVKRRLGEAEAYWDR